MPRLPPSLERHTWLFGPPTAAGHAERSLRLLIIASVLLPLAIFSIAAVISYNQHQADAREQLMGTLGMLHEHAAKVFETFEISETYLEETMRGLPDAEIRGREAELSERIRKLISNVPQLRDLWVIDGNGRPLVAGTVYPLPNMDLSDRDYFSAHRNSNIGTYISRVVQARAADTTFFAITRKRLDPQGRFAGVYLVSIAPEYFTKFYSQLPNDDQTVSGLIRGDGAVLARYPQIAAPFQPATQASVVMSAIATNPLTGFAQGYAPTDGVERLFAYRKLPSNNVYVYTGIETNLIRDEWLASLAQHLIFGIPATVAMMALGIIGLKRTRREALALVQLREEVARRQSTEIALRQAQKMEAVGRLTGGVAHDFNNLLTAIMGNAELAIKRLAPGGDERVARSLAGIRQASQRAATLVQRLLSFSRQHPQEIKTVDINRLVQGMSELLYRTIGETVKIETVLGSGLWKTALDPNQLENAIINLAVNARDAMPEGGRLTIETSNAYLDEAYIQRAGGEIKSGQYVMIAVSDTGSGMSPEVRDKAFEPFFTTKPAGAGSGLGLSMVYGFVKQSAGHVQIYSEIGQGTALKMYFPRLTNETTFPEWDSGVEPVTVNHGQHNECILLVEDDEDVRRFAVDALSDLGYRVESAGDGAAALAILADEPGIALLLTDVILPGGMNGRQLADEALKLRPDLPVLFATGYTRNAIIHHGRLDPDVDLLLKPFSTEALSLKVRHVLDAKRGTKT